LLSYYLAFLGGTIQQGNNLARGFLSFILDS